MMKLSERLAIAMDHAGFDQDQKLVDAIHHTLGLKPDEKPAVSQQVISKIRKNKLKTGRTHVIPYIAYECKVSAIWLAAEVGDMVKVQSGTRFEPAQVAVFNRFLQLNKGVRDHIAGLINTLYAGAQPGREGRSKGRLFDHL